MNPIRLAAVVLVLGVVSLGARAIPGDESDTILRTLERMEVMQLADAHPRLMKHPYQRGTCIDFDCCSLLDFIAAAEPDQAKGQQRFLDHVEKTRGSAKRMTAEILLDLRKQQKK